MVLHSFLPFVHIWMGGWAFLEHFCRRMAAVSVVAVVVAVAGVGNEVVVAAADVAVVLPDDAYFDSKSGRGAVADLAAVVARGIPAGENFVDAVAVAVVVAAAVAIAAVVDSFVVAAVADVGVEVAAVAKVAVVAVGNFGDIHQMSEATEYQRRREALDVAFFSAPLPPSFSARQRSGLAAAETPQSCAADLPPVYA